MISTFLRNEDGFVTTEWAFIATILVLGAVTGFVLNRPAPPSAADDNAPAIVRPVR